MRKAVEKTMVPIGVGITILVLFVLTLAAWKFLNNRHYFNEGVRTKRCAEQLEAIAGAKAEYARDYELSVGDPVSDEHIAGYVERGYDGLSCTGEGTYTLNPVGTPPTCSVAEHMSALGDGGP